MKTLWKKKWVRRLGQTALVLGTLLLLAVVVVNWRGVRDRNRVVAELMREGHPVTLGALLAPLPPDELNFAKIPLIMAARSVGEEKPYAPGSTVEAARTRLNAMNFVTAEPELRKRPQEQNYQEWGKLLGCAGDARSCLKRYDELHAGTLAALREGMSRPYVQSTWVHEIERSGIWSRMNGTVDGYSSMNVVKGLSIRAHAALAAGEPEIALESLAMGYRMVELIGSDELLISVMMKVNACRFLKGALKGGLESGAWDDRQLVRLEEILAKIDLRKDVRRATEVENACWLLMLDYLKQEPAQLAGWVYDSPITRLPLKMRAAIYRMIPRGWFDLNATWELEGHRRRMSLLAQPGALTPLWREGEDLYARTHRGQTAWVIVPGGGYGSLFKAACSGIVANQQARLACELECYRLVHHRYPESLEKIGGELILDPFNGQPFGYRLRDGVYRLFSVGPDGKLTADSPSESRRGALTWIW